jgi:hypothetical protein
VSRWNGANGGVYGSGGAGGSTGGTGGNGLIVVTYWTLETHAILF